MLILLVKRIVVLALLFVKEQFKEPVSIFWMIISPVVTYYLFFFFREGIVSSGSVYLDSSSWFYAYMASNVAFFGFSFYIVGRRESGFIRSFVYMGQAKVVFMLAQFLSCSLISLVYCSVFYVLTCFCFDFYELSLVMARFYCCYIAFSILGMLLSLLPMSFQNSSTVYSAVSLLMLSLGVAGIRGGYPAVDVINIFNPLVVANGFMVNELRGQQVLMGWIFVSFVGVFILSIRYLRLNPVWSRY